MINRSRSALYHFGRFFRFFGTYSVIFTILLAFFVFLPAIAEASTNRTPVIHKINFNDIDGDPVRTLDWRSPTASLTFDVPDNDWVDDVEFLLSAHPTGPVATNAPLLVRFNGATPVPVHTEGYGFDARLRLDRLKLQKNRNQISIEYQVPSGQSCLGAQHGAWDINADNSLVVVTSRPKSRPPHFHDVKTRLAAKATAPQTVALTAYGPQALKLKALAAQGIAQNVKDIPNFRNFSKHAKVDIILGLRDQLPHRAKNDDVRNGSGPSIAVGSSIPLQIIVTGDTEDELMRAAQAFAEYPIPVSYNRELSPMRFVHTAPQIGRIKRVKGKAALSELGGTSFHGGWAPRPQHIYFDVEDPAASFGTLSLGIRAGTNIDPNSTLVASLNGHVLGTVQIDKSRIRATIEIPRGTLQGLKNRLTLMPDLSPAQQACAASRMGPGFTLDAKSSLKIKTAGASDVTDLSRFSASGLPFAADRGSNTHIVFATKNAHETHAALKVIAQLGRASRHGWSNAQFTDGLENLNSDIVGNILVIGSQIDTDMPLFSNAPKGLKVAMGGSLRRDPITTLSAQHAEALPALLSTISPIEGGVAALYRDDIDPNRVIGVVTQTKGHPFTRAVDDLLSSEHWNALEGSVSRWNRNTIIMAQTAMPATQRSQDLKFALNIGELSMPSLPNLKFPEISKPDLEPFTLAVQHKWTELKEKVTRHFSRKSQPTPTQQHTRVDLPNTAGTYTPLRTAARQDTKFLPARPQREMGHMKATSNTRQIPTFQSPRVTVPNSVKKSTSFSTERAPVNDMMRTVPQTKKHDGQRQVWMEKAKSQYAMASEKVSTLLSRTPLTRFGTQDDQGVKLFLFAIIGSLILLLIAIISPLKPDARDQ